MNVRKALLFLVSRKELVKISDIMEVMLRFSSVSESTPIEVLVLRLFLRWRHPFSSTFITEDYLSRISNRV